MQRATTNCALSYSPARARDPESQMLVELTLSKMLWPSFSKGTMPICFGSLFR
jgi:hypothetical protein